MPHLRKNKKNVYIFYSDYIKDQSDTKCCQIRKNINVRNSKKKS